MNSDKINYQIYQEEYLVKIVKFIENTIKLFIFPFSKNKYEDPIKNQMKQIVNKMCILIEEIHGLIINSYLTDEILLKISTFTLSLFLTPQIKKQLRYLSISILREIFTRYESHRMHIFQELFSEISTQNSDAILRSKNDLNISMLNESFIQLFTALILQLIQCCSGVPKIKKSKNKNMKKSTEKQPKEQNPLEEKNNTERDIQKEMIIRSLKNKYKTKNTYGSCLTNSRRFAQLFLDKISTKNEKQKIFEKLLELFIDDLLRALNQPEWPSAELLLDVFTSMILQLFENSQQKQLKKALLIHFLSRIYMGITQHTLFMKENRNQIEEKGEKMRELLNKDGSNFTFQIAIQKNNFGSFAENNTKRSFSYLFVSLLCFQMV
eukprot:Anaeramoba_ignava/a485956_23.p1 GENE.a485956_23~~a485956_23.p1  ORF type:complete len:392 (-),score=110.37 a485956_23:370-1509(-)